MLSGGQHQHTTLLIAHRLSTIRTADLIAVLHDGRVAETGTYDELTKREGIFFRLVAAQRDGHVEQ